MLINTTIPQLKCKIFCSFLPIVFYSAVFCVITQCSFLAGRNLRDFSKSGCEGDYLTQYSWKSLVLTPFGLKGMERAVTQASTSASSGFGRTVNEIWTGNFCSRTMHKSVPSIYKWLQKPETGMKNYFQWRNGTRIYHLEHFVWEKRTTSSTFGYSGKVPVFLIFGNFL